MRSENLPGKVLFLLREAAVMRLLLTALLSACICAPAMALNAVDLTLEYKVNPIGVDALLPRFSWKLDSDQTSTLQTRYRVRVSSRADFSDLRWDSGVVESDQSLFVPYAGTALQSLQRYYWQVQLEDNHGNTSPWSEPAFWEMGLLKPTDWLARWITYPWAENPKASNPSPLFRHEFRAENPVHSARLVITSLGLYQAEINGQLVGEQLFTPGWTAYDERLQYQVYDVTRLLRTGDNAIGVTLGDGWYRGRLGLSADDPEDHMRNIWGDRLALLAQLHIRYTDGSTAVIGTDDSWSTSTGPIRWSDIYDGEFYDSMLEHRGWSNPNFTGEWEAAQKFTGSVPTLVASYGPPVKAVETIAAKSIKRKLDGTWQVDFGQNLVGWVRLRAKGQPGQQVTLRHAEVLTPEGDLYTEALRTARAQADYVLDGSDRSYQPNFTFYGFRFAELSGYSEELTADNIEAVVIHSAMPETGSFETSNASINQLQSNIRWGQKGNFLDVPTDCPQRDERLGWAGDAQAFAPTAAFNMQVGPFFHKWLTDMTLEQLPTGEVPFLVPYTAGMTDYTFSFAGFSLGVGSTGWSDAITIIPSALYQQYGDTLFLESYYASMKAYVDFMAAKAAKQTWWWMTPSNWWNRKQRERESWIYRGPFSFGDWLAPDCGYFGCVPMSYVNTVFLAHSAQLVAEAAAQLGHVDDSLRYRTLADKVKAAFLAEYTANGMITEDSQGALVLALAYDMYPPAQRQPVADRLNQLVLDNGTHLATGFLATPHLLPVLSRFGHIDTAYNLLLQDEYPSWLYTIDMGATTMWERWNSIEPDGSPGDDGMNSYNHYAYGAVGDWMYRTVAGIQPLSPGYKSFRIAPQPGGDLEWVQASLDTGYGRIESSWYKTATGFKSVVKVPANTIAQIEVPGTSPVTVGSGEHRLEW